MSQSKGTQNRLAAVERQRQALALRKAGRTFEEIAATLAYSDPSGAYRAVEAALLRTLREPADELRGLELERLDALLAALWPVALSGDLGAVDRVLRVMERRAKFLGLDAPEKIDVEATVRSLAAERGIDPAAAIAAVREAERVLRESRGADR